MGLMDKIFNRKGDIDPHHDPFGGQDPMGPPPSDDGGFGDQGMPPAGSDPFGGQQGDPFSSQQPPARGMPPQFDTNNPDMNAQLGIPKPDPYKHDSPAPQNQGSPFEVPQQQQQQSIGPAQPSHVEKDLQIIIAKLDAIKSEIDSLHQRVQKIERIADADQQAAAKQAQAQQRYQW